MNKISKSQKIIPTTKINSILSTKQKNTAKFNASADHNCNFLQQKIDKSKPLLQSIYDKVRKKEQLYKQIAQSNVQKCKNANKIASQFKQFSREALCLIHKNRINQHSKQTTIKGEQQQFKRYQSLTNLNKEGSISMKNILSQYSRNKQDKPKEPQSVYERYLNKLQQNKQNKRVVNIKRQENNILNRVRRLSKEIDDDLQKLNLNKNKSANNIKNAAKPQKALYIAQKDRKTYFLQMQKRKLKLL